MGSGSRMRQVLDRLDHTGRDPSAFSLIVANLITIELALLGRWELGQVMRIYWWQSVIIGAFHFVRLLRLEHFHTEGPDESGEVIAPTADEKLRSAAAFILSFGWMHAIYMMFILRLPVERPDYPYLMPVAVVAFGVNHLFSFLKNVESDKRKWRSLPGMVRLAHWRVLPMHGVVMLGLLFQPTRFGVVIFLALKMIADLIMHDQEHLMRADPAPLPSGVGRTDE
jgi:hypothetical protein